jgi:hypothetical protein
MLPFPRAFLLQPQTVPTRQTRQAVRAINQSIFLRCLWINQSWVVLCQTTNIFVQCFKTFLALSCTMHSKLMRLSLSSNLCQQGYHTQHIYIQLKMNKFYTQPNIILYWVSSLMSLIIKFIMLSIVRVRVVMLHVIAPFVRTIKILEYNLQTSR